MMYDEFTSYYVIVPQFNVLYDHYIDYFNFYDNKLPTIHIKHM